VAARDGQRGRGGGDEPRKERLHGDARGGANIVGARTEGRRAAGHANERGWPT
jgi:hypothetical protein